MLILYICPFRLVWARVPGLAVQARANQSALGPSVLENRRACGRAMEGAMSRESGRAIDGAMSKESMRAMKGIVSRESRRATEALENSWEANENERGRSTWRSYGDCGGCNTLVLRFVFVTYIS